MNAELKNKLLSLKLAVFDFDGVFTDNRVLVSESGTESAMCCRSDGIGLTRLRDCGVETIIISTEPNPLVVFRARKLKMECIHGCEDKLSALKAEVEKRSITLEEVAFVGNDINDLSCLENVGLPVVVADAWDEVRPAAELVLTRNGGFGAVREFCDMVCKVRREN